jgi:hypothetical protein
LEPVLINVQYFDDRGDLGKLRREENPSHDVVAFAVEVDSHVAAEFDVLFRQMAFSVRHYFSVQVGVTGE